MKTEAARQTEMSEPEHQRASPPRPYIEPTYYGLPPVKHSHYRWTIGASFFAAGIAGSLELLSTALDVADGRNERQLVRTARYAALAGSVASPLLYIKDLGTPSRWFNMLRIFRPTSLMSVGSWALAVLGMFNGLTGLGQVLEDAGYTKTGRRTGRMSSLMALPSAMLVTPYMGSELEETSTPFWAASSPVLPALFVVSNMSNGLSVLELAAVQGGLQGPVKRLAGLAAIFGVSELLLLKRLENNWVGTERAGMLYRTRHDLLYRTGAITAGRLGALALRMVSLFDTRNSRALLPVASLATLVTGFFLPPILLFAGNRSADRPQDCFSFTRPKALPRGRPGSGETRVLPERTRKRHATRSRTKWLVFALGLGAASAIALVLAGAGRRRMERPGYDMAVA